MSVYKNEQGRQLMATWYQRYLDKLTHPVEFRRVETSFGHTNVLLTGPVDAPPLLSFHGVMASAPSSLSLMEPMIPHFRVIYPDTIGQPGRSAETYMPLRGDSYGRWAAEVMDGMGLDRVACFGVSMGGYIALKLAQSAPQRIKALSLYVPGGVVNTGLWDGLRLSWSSLALYLWPNDKRVRALFDELFTGMDPLSLEYYRDSMTNLRMDRRLPELCPDEAFRNLLAPVQVFAAELDVLFPAQALIQRARRLFPHLVEAEIIPGFKHVPPVGAEASNRILMRLTEFLLREGHSVHPTAS